MVRKLKLAIFASRNGSGFDAIYEAVKNNQLYMSIELLISNNQDSIALYNAKKREIKNYLINKSNFHKYENEEQALENILQSNKIDYIFLSGYMKKVPSNITQLYKNKIINSHPSLLPKYGGKGMYGRYVHEAVVKNHEKQTGITIHLVNEVYDDGEIIYQKSISISKEDTPQIVEQKVKKQEGEAIITALNKYCFN